MPVLIQRFTTGYTRAVIDLNYKLKEAGEPEESQLPEQPESTPDEQYFIAVEGADVRGGYTLNYQNFTFAANVHSIAHYRRPVSEGIVDRFYTPVGVQLIRDALRREPCLFCLGMGGMDRRLPRLLKTLGWSIGAIPFYFQVRKGRRFLHQIRALRTSKARRIALDLAAYSGLGALVFKSRQALRRSPAQPDIAVHVVPAFDISADTLWDQVKAGYAAIAVRNAERLNALYPATGRRFIRLQISRRQTPIGWAVILDTRMENDHYFGNLRVGAIADCLAAPENADPVIRAAAEFLGQRGVDLIVANHSHLAWTTAFHHAGFLEGPSNYLFAASPRLGDRIGPFESNFNQIYLNRGDGDGPVHL